MPGVPSRMLSNVLRHLADWSSETELNPILILALVEVMTTKK